MFKRQSAALNHLLMFWKKKQTRRQCLHASKAVFLFLLFFTLGSFPQIPNDNLTRRRKAINHNSSICTILFKLFYSLTKNNNQREKQCQHDNPEPPVFPGSSWRFLSWITTGTCVQTRGCRCMWPMTHTYQRALTHRRTLHPCAQSRWLSLELWERSLSSVTSGNTGRAVECVNARLTHGTEPKPTEGTVRLLMRVRCVPERHRPGASGIFIIFFKLFFFFLHHTCVSCLLDHELLKKIVEMSQSPAHEDTLLSLSLLSRWKWKQRRSVKKVQTFCTVKQTISAGLRAIFVLLTFLQFYHSKWAKLGSQTILLCTQK